MCGKKVTSILFSTTLCLILAGPLDEDLKPIPETQAVPVSLGVLEIGITPCQHCGVCSCRHKVCRVVCVTDKLKKTVWTVQVKDYCVPKPRLCGGCNTCVAGDLANPSARPDQVPPKCSPVRTRQELVKKEITLEKPIWKCTVMCCGHCPGDCHFANVGQRSIPNAPSDPVNPDTPKATTTMRDPAVREDEEELKIRVPRFE